MKLGIDFGTSNSAAAALVDGQLEQIRFGDAAQFRTTVYFPGTVAQLDDFQLTPALEHELDATVEALQRAAQAAGQPRPLAALRREALRSVRRSWMEEQMRQPRSSSSLLQNAVYGDAALEAYLEEHEGNLVQSPKSMLGYNLHPRAKDTITGIASHILEHIRLTASQQLGTPVRTALIGRPVQFRSSIGDAGNQQALDILRAAAEAAGFDAVDFLEEPAAAAMGHHAGCSVPEDIVVVDVGGGTTDIAHATVGGDGAPRVHRAWGIPLGGTDIDLALSLAAYMPLFGRGQSRVPAHHYVEAAMVQDTTRQRDFLRHDYRDVPSPWGERLQALQDTGNTARLYRQVEGSKIALSSHALHHSPLDFIEPGLSRDIPGSQLSDAAGRYLEQLQTLLDQVRTDIGHIPGTLFLTGGMSRAGYIRDAAMAAFPGARVVAGDPSFGVVQGLALAAAQRT